MYERLLDELEDAEDTRIHCRANEEPRVRIVDIRNERFWETEEPAVYIRQLGTPNIPMPCTSN